AFYSFELSFPLDFRLGVSYDPWHWRFVGDRHSLESFYKARSIVVASPSELVIGDI
ncbi:MAG: D-alanyl-D-alanine carboxypeptidase family protein, partial [Limnospira maxima]